MTEELLLSQQCRAAAVEAYRTEADLIDAACRLVRLLDRSEGVFALGPQIEREILYRL